MLKFFLFLSDFLKLWYVLQNQISLLSVYLHTFTETQISSNTVTSVHRASYELVADITATYRAS